MTLQTLRRSSLLYWLSPKRYILSDYDWEEFSLEFWSWMEYEWRQDAWNGMKDTVQYPEDTIESGSGDCEDYTLVALSCLHETTDHDLRLVAMYTWELPPLGHLVLYDETEEVVYSSGDIEYKPLADFFTQSKYDVAFHRKI